jgi:transglutaminase-like putative cysteine protease
MINRHPLKTLLVMRLLSILLLFTFFSVHAQQGFLVNPEPDWIEKITVSHDIADTTDTSDGIYYLLINRQYHLEKEQFYQNNIIKVLSESGLSIVSSINESFDPSFQKLIFHKLLVHRNGQVINKLDKQKFELIRREEGMDRALYDKSLSAIYNMPDIRVGDVVEYSFTVEGINPVFGNHVFGSLYFNYSVPVGKIVNKIICNKSRDLTLKYFNMEKAANDRIQDGLRHIQWDFTHVPALLTDDALPAWYDPYQHVQYSDFKSWDKVAAWASDLFKVTGKNSDEMNRFLMEVQASSTTEEKRILKCIEFVQREIRYLSFSDGIHGYKPHPPNQVFDQKFGDCKDKSLLLCHLLNQIGIKSYPALVSTSNGHVIPDALPSPWMFNHCVAQIYLRDSVYWIDPTLSPQVGKLDNFFFPHYEHALVIDSNTKALSAITKMPTESVIDVKEEYFIGELGGFVTLKVRTEYRGEQADEMRYYKNNNSKDAINKNFLNFYANDYSDIVANTDAVFEDNQEENIITSQEEYTLKNFWNYDSVQSKNAAYTYARILASNITKPTTRIRSMPLYISHPRKIFQHIKIYLPEEWGIEDATKRFESDGFVYESSVTYWEKTLSLRYSYESKAHFIAAENAIHHIEQLDQVLNDLSYSIFYTPQGSAATTFNYQFLIISIIAAVAIWLVCRHLYYYNPEPLSDDTLYDGIGGWLVLLGIGVIFNPLMTIYALMSNGYFNAIQWQILTDSQYVAYNPLLGGLVIFELMANIASLGFSILLVILFFQRRSSVPRLMSAFFAFHVGFIFIDLAWGFSIDVYNRGNVSTSVSELVKLLIRAGIWIPYLFLSDRSKGTFTQRLYDR